MTYRHYLIRFFTFLGGIYFFLEFVLPEQIGGFKLGAYHENISNGFAAIGTVAVGLGLINLFMVHGAKIAFLKKGWIDSSALFVGLFLMAFVTIQDWMATEHISKEATAIMVLGDFAERIKSDYEGKVGGVPTLSYRNQKLKEAVHAQLSALETEAASPDTSVISENDKDFKLLGLYQKQHYEKFLQTKDLVNQLKEEEPNFEIHEKLAQTLGELGVARRQLKSLLYDHSRTRKFYNLLYEGLFVALGAAMFSLLAFYMAAAAYRAFRIRSLESALMMTAALLVMLGQIPFGLWLWDRFPDVRLWLLTVPNSAAFRAIKIGAEVAGLVMAFRMWFSIESESFAERS